MSLKSVLIILVLFGIISFVISVDLCSQLTGNWTLVSGISTLKCITILANSGNATDAEKNCTDKDAELLVLHSALEEQVVINHIHQNHLNSPLVWLGLKWNTSSYQWADGSPLTFSNWASLPIGSAKPFVYFSVDSELWSASDGKTMANIVCQKTITLDVFTLFNLIQDGQFIPNGFIYTQLPQQLSPQELWPKLQWSDVTKEYKGLFFRAEGGGSLPFEGGVQESNHSRISEIEAQGFNYTGWDKSTPMNVKGPISYPIEEGNWTRVQPGSAFLSLRVFETQGENVPENTAIRLWKRVG